MSIVRNQYKSIERNNMKKVILASAIALGLSMNANAGLSKEDKAEYMVCQKIAWVAENYGITWFDTTSWQETLALYQSEMSPLQIRKMDKKVEREIKKAKRTMDDVVDKLSDHIPEEHHPYIVYTGIVLSAEGEKGFYECQL